MKVQQLSFSAVTCSVWAFRASVVNMAALTHRGNPHVVCFLFTLWTSLGHIYMVSGFSSGLHLFWWYEIMMNGGNSLRTEGRMWTKKLNFLKKKQHICSDSGEFICANIKLGLPASRTETSPESTVGKQTCCRRVESRSRSLRVNFLEKNYFCGRRPLKPSYYIKLFCFVKRCHEETFELWI